MTSLQQGTRICSSVIDRELSICFATRSRPYCAQRLIRSIRALYPSISILVADQGEPEEATKRFYADHQVTPYFLPEDTGVGGSRNLLVSHVRTPYFIICDDDFVFTPETNFDGALYILEKDDEVAIVGGKLRDTQDFRSIEEGSGRYWECFLFLDKQHGLFFCAPISAFRPIIRMAGPFKYYICDAVMNFAIMRTKLFTEHGHGWDQRFICNGEHEDFYLQLKQDGRFKVAYFPQLICLHHQPLDPSYAQLRRQQEGWAQFAAKWGIRQYIDRDGRWRPFCLEDQGAVQLDDDSFVAASDFTGTYISGWKDGLVGVAADGSLFRADPGLGDKRTHSTPPRALLAAAPYGEIRTVSASATTQDPAASCLILNPTDLSLLRDEVRSGISLQASSLRGRFVAGQMASVLVKVINRTGHVLPMGVRGPFQIYFSYHLRRFGSYVVWDGERSRPVSDLFNESLHIMRVLCPEQPGRYEIEIDILIDGVAWLGVPTQLDCVVEPDPLASAA